MNSAILRVLSSLTCLLPICSDAASPKTSREEPASLYGALQMAPEHFAIGRKQGWRVALVGVSWDRFEPKPGVFDQKYIKELAGRMEELRKLDYLLMLDLGVQYPPAWVFDLPQGRYTNQFGDSFISTQSGEDLPNVVFNADVRKHVASYFGEVFSRLGSDWDFVRLGCGKFGELNYPQDKFQSRSNCYWAFDDRAQGKAPGLPDGLVACPVPGWIPGASSPGHWNAEKFIEWYFDCLKNYQDWQIATVRGWYAGDICMLYGSWGLRPGWSDEAIRGDLNGSSPCERNGEIQQGFDWERMIGGIRDSRVIVYCTWVDGTISNRDIADDNNSDSSRWSPVHWQSCLARSNPLHLRVWGENTGHNNREAMAITFERVKRDGLPGVMWAFDSELFADPNPKGYATFADFSAFLRDKLRVSTTPPKPE